MDTHNQLNRISFKCKFQLLSSDYRQLPWRTHFEIMPHNSHFSSCGESKKSRICFEIEGIPGRKSVGYTTNYSTQTKKTSFSGTTCVWLLIRRELLETNGVWATWHITANLAKNLANVLCLWTTGFFWVKIGHLGHVQDMSRTRSAAMWTCSSMDGVARLDSCHVGKWWGSM